MTPRPLGQSFIEGGCGVDEVCADCHEKCGDDIACKHTCDEPRAVASNHLQAADCYPLPPLNRLAAMCPTELAVCQTAPGCSELLQKALNREAPAAWMHNRQLLAINQCWACSEAECVEPGACLLVDSQLASTHARDEVHACLGEIGKDYGNGVTYTNSDGSSVDCGHAPIVEIIVSVDGYDEHGHSFYDGPWRVETDMSSAYFCQAYCAEHPECTYFSYAPGYCYLKTDYPDPLCMVDPYGVPNTVTESGPGIHCDGSESGSGPRTDSYHCDITVASASSCQAIGGSYCRHADSGAETLQMAQAFPACQKELQACVGTPGVACVGGNCTLASHAAVAPVHGCAEMVQSWLSHTGSWAGIVTGSSKAHAAARSVLGCIVVSHEGPEFADDAEWGEPTRGQCDDVAVITACLQESPQVDESCKPVSAGLEELCADGHEPGMPGVPAQCFGTSETGETCDLDASTNHTAECPAGCESMPSIPAVPGNCPSGCELHTAELPSCREEFLAVVTKER
eukprot:COSAG04_NODE_1477_length_6575_cov_1.852532_2_plen_512_part_00